MSNKIYINFIFKHLNEDDAIVYTIFHNSQKAQIIYKANNMNKDQRRRKFSTLTTSHNEHKFFPAFISITEKASR